MTTLKWNVRQLLLLGDKRQVKKNEKKDQENKKKKFLLIPSKEPFAVSFALESCSTFV